MSRLVCHLLDSTANLHMPFFRFIEREHDCQRFPVRFCLIQPHGKSKNPTWEVRTLADTLGIRSRRGYPIAVMRLARCLRRNKVAILHAHLYEPTLIGLVAARLARVPFVYTRHHSDHVIRTGKPWYVAVDAWCGRHADQVIAVSEATRRIMIDVEKVPSTQITTVYNGMDLLKEPAAEEVARLRVELGLGSVPVILMVARLHEEKGHRFLFESVLEVISRFGPIQVLLAGEGPHRSSLEASVREYGLETVIRFLGRVTNVPELLALSTLVVQPSLAESFGYALVEAMSLGKPIVATACGGIPEVLGDNQAGLLVPIADSLALSEAILRVLQSPELAIRLGEAGRRRAEMFRAERMVRGYEDVYQRILDRC